MGESSKFNSFQTSFRCNIFHFFHKFCPYSLSLTLYLQHINYHIRSIISFFNRIP
nr:MAG TPA: hypothetical protein [Caudoviricetes sp.]